MAEKVVVPPATPGGLALRLPDESRETLLCFREGFDATREERERFEDLEAPIREIEEELETRPPGEKRRSALLAESAVAVAAASEAQGRVRSREQKVLDGMKELVQRIRAAQKGGGPDLTDVVEEIQLWYRLRCVEMEWIDTALRHSRALADLPPDAATSDLHALLRRRRESMDRVNSLLGKAAEAEGILFGTERKRPALAIRARPPSGEDGGMKTKNGEQKRKTSAAAPEEPEEEPLVEQEKEASAPAPEEPPEAPVEERKKKATAPAREEPAEEPVDEGVDVERPFFDLERQLAAFGAAAGAAREEVRALHDRALAVAAREKAELEERLSARIQKVETDLEEAIREHEAAEEQVRALRKARDEIRQAAEAREKEIEEERAKLEEERARMKEEVRVAHQERDEALVLISSLTRRLGTPGLPGEGGASG